MLDLNRKVKATKMLRSEFDSDKEFCSYIYQRIQNFDYYLLISLDNDLYTKFRSQEDLILNSDRNGDSADIKRHGESMLRGIDLCQKAIDLALSVQKGAGKDPGPPPPRARGSTNSHFKAWYKLYTLCERWERKRQSVLRRCNFICEGCAEAPATQVHHLTYDHVGSELLFELVGLCAACHERVHS